MDLLMFRKGLNPRKTYYQINKEKEEKEEEKIIPVPPEQEPIAPSEQEPIVPPEPVKRKRGRPRKNI
jgi:hypothetical protein